MTSAVKTISSPRILVTSFMTICVAGFLSALAQQPQQNETTRHLWDTAFIDQGKKTVKKPARRRYTVITPRVSTNGVSPDTVIGVTLWRLRPARRSDTGERIIAHESANSIEWLPERVSSSGKLAEGDRIRISIEAARTGYLYVVNQEEYADGSKGEPYLIFPTTRTLGGNNSVQAGRVIEIPSQDDNPPYFTLKRTRVGLVGENMIVLVSPTPIESLTITDQAQKLSAETLRSWEKSWGAPSGRLELNSGEGKPWTKQEKEAGGNATRAMKQADASPQTLYYRPGVSSKDPVLIKVQLHYSRSRPSVRSR